MQKKLTLNQLIDGWQIKGVQIPTPLNWRDSHDQLYTIYQAISYNYSINTSWLPRHKDTRVNATSQQQDAQVQCNQCNQLCMQILFYNSTHTP